jgi:hypothetical protein
MAKFETFQDMKDASDELETLCGEVKEGKYKEALLKAAQHFQKFAAMMESSYWKAPEENVVKMASNIRQMTEKVKEIIKYESEDQG